MRKVLLIIGVLLAFQNVQAQWNNVTASNNLVCGTSPTTNKYGNVSTTDGAGGMFVAWIDSRDSSSKSIYIQRILTDGTLKFAQEVLVSNATGTLSSTKSNLVIAADSNGGAILVWVDARNITSTNSNSDIYGQRIDADGNVLWAKDGVRLTLADNSKSNKGAALPILVDKSEFILIYNDNINGTFDFFAQKVSLTDGSLLWSSNASLHGSKPNVQTQATALSDGKGGAFVVWQDPRLANTNNDIYGQYIDNSGKLLWDTAGLAICTAQNQQLTPQLIADGSGGIVVAWSDQRAKVADGNIYAQRINAAGAIQWAKDGVLVCDYTGNQAVPNIVKGGNGYIIAWSDARKATNDRNIFAQSIDATGTPQWTTATAGGVPVCQATGAQPINYTNAQNIKMLPDGNNGAFIIWDDGRNTIANIDIYAQRITSSGTVSSGWLPDGNIVCNALKNQQSPGVVLDDLNNVIIAWNDERDSTYNIYASKLSPDGSLVLPVHFVSLNAVSVNNSVSISWKTANESPNSNYIIEQSTDGVNFSEIGNTKSTGSKSYTFIDNSPTSGENYYRIRVIDNLGNIFYSSVVKLSISATSRITINVFPNPVFNFLSLSFTNFSQGGYQINLVNVNGRVVKCAKVNIQSTSATTNLQVGDLSAGSYFLRVMDSKGAAVANKIIVKQ